MKNFPMKASVFWCVGVLCAISSIPLVASISGSIRSYRQADDDRIQWEESDAGLASENYEPQVFDVGAERRRLQAWRGSGLRAGSSGYTTSYNSMGGSPMTMSTSSISTSPAYSGTYNGGTTYFSRASPAGSTTYSMGTSPSYSSSGTTFASYPSASSTSGTTYYSGGSISTTYTGGSSSSVANAGFSGSSRPGSSTGYASFSGSTTPFSSGLTYSGSSLPYSGSASARADGYSGGFGTSGGSAFTDTTVASPTYYAGSSSGVRGVSGGSSLSTARGGATYTGSSVNMGPTYHSNTIMDGSPSSTMISGGASSAFIASDRPRQGTSSTGMPYATTTISGGAHGGMRAGTATATGSFGASVPTRSNIQPPSGYMSTSPGPMSRGIAGSDSSRPVTESTSTSPGPFRDSSRGRGSSSFRSSGGGSATSPLEQGDSGTTYYLREADGSLTPIEPPPYDQMKPDSYYTDLYLTDQPIRFENHRTKEQQFKRELEKAHASNVENQMGQPTQGVMSLPITEEKKGVM